MVNPTFVIADGSNGSNYFVTLISALGTIKPLPTPNLEPSNPSPPPSNTAPVDQSNPSTGFPESPSQGSASVRPAAPAATAATTTTTIDSTSSQTSVSSQEQATLGMAQRLNLAEDASQQQSLSTQQVQSLLNQIENVIRAGTP